MNQECTLQLPQIGWSPRPAKKTAPTSSAKPVELEHMSLNELLYLALTSAR